MGPTLTRVAPLRDLGPLFAAQGREERQKVEQRDYVVRSPFTPSAACAAASRAIGTRYGLHDT